MNSLFFVSSPLEMICAIEARSQFQTKNNILVLYLFEVDISIVNYIISLGEKWEKVYRLNRSSINYGKKFVVLTNKLKKNKYQYFFSTGMTFAAHFLFNIQFEKQYFLDDGTLTLHNVSLFEKEGSLTRKLSLFPGHDKYKFKHKLNEALHFLFGHKLRGKVEELNLFTFFKIQKKPKIHVVENKLLWFDKIKKTNILNQEDNLVYIIGSPLVFAKIINENYYFELIQQIIAKFSNKKMIYVKHRWEQKEDIENIQKRFNLKILENENIIEIDFLKKGILPKHIVGTISTALFTLKNLYPSANIYSTSLELQKVYEDKRISVSSILDYQKGLFKKI